MNLQFDQHVRSSIISNKNNKIARMETEKEVQTERIAELEKNVTGLRKEEQEALQMERNLKEKLKQQQQKQEALENKIIELERQRRMMRLQECCAQHPESEKMMELLDFLKGNTVCNFGNSEIRDLLVSLTDMISPDAGSRIVKHVQNEKKQIICNLIALGIDDVAIISKVVILNERTIRKYHRECQIKKGELSMHTMVRFLTALRLRTDQETLEEFVIHALRCLFDREDGELRRMLEGK